jgi:hypothetical protein
MMTTSGTSSSNIIQSAPQPPSTDKQRVSAREKTPTLKVIENNATNRAPTEGTKMMTKPHHPSQSVTTGPGADETPPPGGIARAGTPTTPNRGPFETNSVDSGALASGTPTRTTPNPILDPFVASEKILMDHLGKIAELKTRAVSNVNHKTLIHEDVFASMYSTVQKALQTAQAAHQAYENLKSRYDIETETKPHLENDNSHNCNCNKKLDEIKEAVDALARTRTYADAAAGRFKVEAELAKKERIEKAKLEQGKKVITISFRDATDPMKERLKTMNSQELTQLIKGHISSHPQCTSIIPRSVRKAGEYTVKIECQQESDALELKQVQWDELEQAKLFVQQYGYVAHGVPKDVINPQPGVDQHEMIANIESQNEIKVSRIEPLMKNPKNPSAPTHSVVLFSEAWEDADKIIDGCLRVNGRWIHAVERYMPECQLVQCYKCQGFGHRAKSCKGHAKCGKCGEEHETRQHIGNKVKCANCNEEHHSGHHDCPCRKKELERLERLKATIPPTYGSSTVC